MVVGNVAFNVVGDDIVTIGVTGTLHGSTALHRLVSQQ